MKGLTVVSNNCGADELALLELLKPRHIKKKISSYVGENKLFADLYLSGRLELELNPQGTLAERIRAGGAGIPAFFTRTGVVKACKAAPEGNLVYRETARNFNPMMATAGRVCVAEVEEIVEQGALDADHIHTPGVYVDRLIVGRDYKKWIEQRTVRQRAPATAGTGSEV